MNWEILIRYVNGEGSAEENAELDIWLNEKAENRIILKQLQLKKKQLNQPVKDDMIHAEWAKVLDRVLESPKAHRQDKVVNLFCLFGIAATVLVACCVTWYYLKGAANGKEEIVVVNTVKERRRVQLPDGSAVYLAPYSRLVISGAFGKKARELTLTGEAFFDVRHDARKPFIISTANRLKVNVLGTSFNVYSRKGINEEVKVATGRVGVVTGRSTVFLKGGEQVDYFLATGTANKRAVKLQDAASLQNGTLYFDNSGASDIARKITRYYNIRVKVAASAQKHHRFSGEMRDYGLIKLLDGLRFATGIRYKIKNQNSILLY